mmetsp:Transcript_17679/g.57320  ORF Transcript_17679/g.57320 Transcript_17679/m.57320 type:complete len:93 (-) Transcript_17679:667-945(-)
MGRPEHRWRQNYARGVLGKRRERRERHATTRRRRGVTPPVEPSTLPHRLFLLLWSTPPYSWHSALSSVIGVILLAIVCYLLTYHTLTTIYVP